MTCEPLVISPWSRMVERIKREAVMVIDTTEKAQGREVVTVNGMTSIAEPGWLPRKILAGSPGCGCCPEPPDIPPWVLTRRSPVRVVALSSQVCHILSPGLRGGWQRMGWLPSLRLGDLQPVDRPVQFCRACREALGRRTSD